MAHETMQTHVEMVELMANDEPVVAPDRVEAQIDKVDDQVTQS